MVIFGVNHITPIFPSPIIVSITTIADYFVEWDIIPCFLDLWYFYPGIIILNNPTYCSWLVNNPPFEFFLIIWLLPSFCCEWTFEKTDRLFQVFLLAFNIQPFFLRLLYKLAFMELSWSNITSNLVKILTISRNYEL